MLTTCTGAIQALPLTNTSANLGIGVSVLTCVLFIGYFFAIGRLTNLIFEKDKIN